MTAPREQKMWGGRFERGPDASFYEFERSWSFDRRLLPQELALDRAWARAIVAAGILTEEEGQQIATALGEIALRAQSDAAWLAGSPAEDVHHFVESALIEKLGTLGAKLHTGRSRNEMVATEFRMYVREAAQDLRRALAALQRAIAAQAESNLKIPMPARRTCSTRNQFCFRTGCWRTVKPFIATPNASPQPPRAPTIARSAPAPLPAALFRSIAMLSRAIWDFRAPRPIAWMPSATATSPSNFFSRFLPLRCISRAWPKILCCLPRPNSLSSSCPTNFPPAAA